MSETVERCAAALYGMAAGERERLIRSGDALLGQSALWNALCSAAVSREEKEELLASAPELEGCGTLRGFLNLLLREGTLEKFPEILEEVRRLDLGARGGELCVVTCAREPDDAMRADLKKAACRLAGTDQVALRCRVDPELLGGFVLEIRGVTYDYSVKGRLDRLARGLEETPGDGLEDLIRGMRDTIQGFQPGEDRSETGRVREVGDGIATVSGLDRAVYGELVELDTGVRGMVLNLARDNVGVVLLGSEEGVREGTLVRRTGHPADVPVGEKLIGRVVDALGRPIDGMGPIETSETRPIEHEASGVISREPVNVPLQTGILAIDAMVPIGRGQRELIIGDRQTGKTAIAVDAIINQKGKDVVCIYVAIGQKASSVARIRDTLEKCGAMEYSVILSATASDSAPLQYIAPYAGAAMGEYFMSRGRDVLIVYDDLSKHAVAYRTLSLLLKRSPGREAYPGDVVYLHSRLLERACRLTKEYGGGSMTALPIIETQAGDVSAYIPTNVISITDGQIYLETDLFFAGQRPAINVGLSVSRVGGAAQTRAIKKTAGTLRIDLARFRELEVFTQFASDLDPATQKTLDHGRRLLELLKQPLYHPMPVSRQAVVLYAAANGLVDGVPLHAVRDFMDRFIRELETAHGDVMREIDSTGDLSGPAIETIRAALDMFKKQECASWQA